MEETPTPTPVKVFENQTVPVSPYSSGGGEHHDKDLLEQKGLKEKGVSK